MDLPDDQNRPTGSATTPLSKRVPIAGILLSKLARFALVSAIGLAIDVCLFLSLVNGGLRSGLANLLSAATAVTFVYFVSTRRIFDYEGRFLLQLFVFYAIYQVLAVVAASWAVDKLVGMGVIPLIAKSLILPVTFSANYVFMDFLTRTRS
jgi:putative flippase GtrA